MIVYVQYTACVGAWCVYVQYAVCVGACCVYVQYTVCVGAWCVYVQYTACVGAWCVYVQYAVYVGACCVYVQYTVCVGVWCVYVQYKACVGAWCVLRSCYCRSVRSENNHKPQRIRKEGIVTNRGNLVVFCGERLGNDPRIHEQESECLGRYWNQTFSENSSTMSLLQVYIRWTLRPYDYGL